MIEYKIVKFIEVLNDLGLIEADIYKKIKYGTSNEIAIMMIKNGYSNSLATLLISRYEEFLDINLSENTVFSKPALLNEMKKNNENDILVFEASFNVKNI